MLPLLLGADCTTETIIGTFVIVVNAIGKAVSVIGRAVNITRRVVSTTW